MKQIIVLIILLISSIVGGVNFGRGNFSFWLLFPALILGFFALINIWAELRSKNHRDMQGVKISIIIIVLATLTGFFNLYPFSFYNLQSIVYIDNHSDTTVYVTTNDGTIEMQSHTFLKTKFACKKFLITQKYASGKVADTFSIQPILGKKYILNLLQKSKYQLCYYKYGTWETYEENSYLPIDINEKWFVVDAEYIMETPPDYVRVKQEEKKHVVSYLIRK